MRATTLFTRGFLAALVVATAGVIMAGFTTAAAASTTAGASLGVAAARAGAAGAATAAGASGDAGATRVAESDGGGGSVAACTAYADQAIRSRVRVTGIPAACRGLSPGEISFAASTAIRIASGTGTKSAVRKRAGEAAPWVNALLGPVPVAPGAQPAVSGGASAGGSGGTGSRIGFSETVAKAGGLAAWLAAAASGGWALLRWWLAAGGLGLRGGLRRLRRRTATAAPSVVSIGHVSLALTGLLLWTVFVITGWVPLAWTCASLLAPVAGLGMGLLLLGLPSPGPAAGDEDAAPAPATDQPRSPVVQPAAGGGLPAAGGPGTAVLEASPGAPRARVSRWRGEARQPVVAIVAHGIFAATALSFVLLAAIGAG